MTYKRFIKGATHILKDKDWTVYQSLWILNQSILSFFSISMLSNGYTEREVLTAFALHYGMIVGSLFYITKTPSLIERRLKYVSTSILSSLLFSLFYQNWYIYLAPLIMTGFAIMKDRYCITAISNLKDIGVRTGNSEKDMVSLSSLIGFMIPVIFMPIFGILNHYGLTYVIITYITVLTVSLVVKSRTSLQYKQEEMVNNEVKNKIKIPKKIHLICGLSTAANMVSFVLKFFITPTIMLLVAKDLGFGHESVKMFGMFLGVLGMIAVLSSMIPTKSSPKSADIMLIGYSVVILSSMLLTVLALFYETINSPILVAALVIAVLTSLEVASKIWTVNFIDTLCSQSHDEESKQAYLSKFMIYKSTGGFLGFALVAAMYNLLTPYLLVIILCALSLIYAVFTSVSIREEAQLEQN